ncbi:MAG: capsule biosynthesis protein [Legionella sp.]|uniref:capsule biosynthesis protein n=1 Tax=Legionella sp. TaxID=459 RepID=UPI0028451438|nr:capsule biosynthesis protein [Legionella sp.]
MDNFLKKLASLGPKISFLDGASYGQRLFEVIQKLILYVNSMNRLFLFSVVIPVLLSIIYFGLIASDVYVVESQFVIRDSQHKTMNSLDSMLSHSGLMGSPNNNFIIQNYILSGDALRFLEKQLNIEEHYRSEAIDRFNRFAGLTWDNSFESLLEYYKKHIGVAIDSASSISTLTVRAFSAEKAYEINHALLRKSEALVNQINKRARQDMLRFATEEVTNAEQKAKKTALALLAYRQKNQVFDPVKQTTLELQRASKLEDELILKQDQLRQMETLTPKNPQLSVLRQKVASLKNNISIQKGQIAGKQSSLSNKALGYEHLKLENTFAQKQLAAALSSLEQARIDAARKQIYLERIENPFTPESAIEPKRILDICSTLLLSLVVWGVLSMFIAGVKEHRD